MGWGTIGGHASDDKAMTDAQRRAIRSLQAQLDGKHVGDYEQYEIPEMSRLEASQRINTLKTRLDRRKKPWAHTPSK